MSDQADGKIIGRNEEEVLMQEFTMILKGEAHVVTVKSIRDTRDFRVILGKMLGSILAPLVRDQKAKKALDGLKPDEMLVHLLPNMMGEGVDSICELPLAYAPELKDAIESASDMELFAAGAEVLKVTFPLVQQMVKTITDLMGRIGQNTP